VERGRTVKESSMQKHIGRVMKKMNIQVKSESNIFGGLARVDFRFMKTLKSVKEGIIVAMEVDGPSHFLLELPSGAGKQLPEGPGGPTSRMHDVVDGAAVDASKHLGEVFSSVCWGALHAPCPCMRLLLLPGVTAPAAIRALAPPVFHTRYL
jgi:hypothetical protein